MDFAASPLAPEDLAGHATEALLLLLPAEAGDWRLSQALRSVVQPLVDSGDLALKAGKSLYLHRPQGLAAQRLMIVVAGKSTLKSALSALNAGLVALRSGGAVSLTVAWAGPDLPARDWPEGVARAACDAVYTYRHTKPSAPEPYRLEQVTLAVVPGSEADAAVALARARAVADGIELAREWGNRPGNHATPTHLAEQALELGRQYGFEVEVLDVPALEALGMGSFLSVGRGSEQPPKFIVMRHRGAAAPGLRPLVLVGKGITFDTGGISLKPGAEMDEMKFDMCGAASVLGVFRALGDLRPALDVIGLIPAAENMPGGRATKPGDVVTSLSGKTIEILNTDAEGRLVLCDALTYAERFEPAAVVDIATLTGACIIALGHHHSGLFSPDDALAAALTRAGEAVQDTVWRLPVDEEYDDALKSNFADMANVGPRAGGSITAAMFLKRFTASYRWAHLDIAGTAWKSGAVKGATGRPVALLTRFLLEQVESPLM